MPPARRRDAKRLRHGERFVCTVEDEVANGIHWPSYRHRLSLYLLPHPDASAERAAADIRLARAHEIDMDDVEAGSPGTEPTWPHYRGQR